MTTLVRKHFDAQGKSCERLFSPVTARLLRLAAVRLDDTTPFTAAILAWPDERMKDDALALRFAGALHALVLSGQAPALAAIYPPHPMPAADDAFWAVVMAAIRAHGPFLLDFLDHPPQTNETGRSAVLMLGFQEVARRTGLPLAMFEIGASAGLNMNWDAFAYDYAGATWGPADSPVRLVPEWRGATPPDLVSVTVAGRMACDRNPLDLTDTAERLRLRSYVWPDQPDRLARLDGAIGIALARGHVPVRADAADWAEANLPAPRPGATRVVYHSIFWQYLPRAIQARLVACFETTGAAAPADSPFAWVRMEPDPDDIWRARLSVRIWPDGTERVLAHCDYHGRWIAPATA
ncbi:MAG: DUF2332 family protein [Pseudomonadota bacterium]|nr:DUF2332 family protein [Pseudomonadota bacterium]